MNRLLAIALLALMVGCASTPAPSPTPVTGNEAPVEDATSILGTWKEHWGIPGETDISYHDQYTIQAGPNGRIEITVDPEDQQISDEDFDGDVLTLTVRTSFDVRYRLTLTDDGEWLEGTATTPDQTVQIRWERVR